MQFITAKPFAQFVTMTPEIVDGLLSLNTKNRNQRPFVINHYRRQIEAGAWVPTNQGIGVSASGFLIDGQHRLEALRACGYPSILMLVVTGLPDEAMAAVDGGTNRRPSDYLQFLFDIKVSAFVSAVLRTSMLARDGFIPRKYTPNEFASHFQLIGDSISAVVKLEGVGKLPAAVCAALVDAHHKRYEAEVESFAKALVTGEMLEKDSPALVLRNWIASTSGTMHGAEGVVERYRKTTRAMQAWIDQRPLAKLYSTKSPLATAISKQRALQ